MQTVKDKQKLDLHSEAQATDGASVQMDVGSVSLRFLIVSCSLSFVRFIACVNDTTSMHVNIVNDGQ